MHAIIEDSGTQIKVTPGDIIDVDPRETGGDSITFDRVLMIGGDEPARIGTPYVDGATVTADVLGDVKGDKLDVIKFKRRKGYRVKRGHRQPYLRVRIKDING